MIAGVRSDPTMALAAVVAVAVMVLLARHGRTWWHRHTGDHHPARIGRLLIAGLALLGLGVLTAGMALRSDAGATADQDPDADDGRVAPGEPDAVGARPADPGEGPPIVASAGS